MSVNVFLSFSLLFIMPLMASPMCAHCSLDSLAGSNTGTRHSCLLCCITYCCRVPVCVPFPFSPDHCWQQTSLPTARTVFFLCCWRLLSDLKLYYIFRKAPWCVILEPCMLGWFRLSQGSGFSTVADHLEPQAADRSLLADKSAAQHH